MPRKKSMSKMFLISDPDKYEQIQQQKLQSHKQPKQSNKQHKQSSKCSEISPFVKRYVELSIQNREWSIVLFEKTKRDIPYEEIHWNRWTKKRDELYVNPIKMLSNEQKQFENIKNERISDGIKILRKEQLLLDACIAEYLIKDKNEYVWNLNVKELEDMRDECDYYDVNRANVFGINHDLTDAYRESDDDVMNSDHHDRQQGLFGKTIL
eukprot:211464_1